MPQMFQLSDPKLGRNLAEAIRLLAPRDPVKLVHVCGTHEIAIARNGLRRMLPDSVTILEGPGCPVCVTPARDIEVAIQIAEQGAILCSYGDMLRVPGVERSLDQARADGCDIRTVLSADEAVRIARRSSREVVFFAVGFETTAPMTAAIVLDRPPPNLSILLSHKRIPPAMESLLDAPDVKIDGYLAPGHVSTIIGTGPYRACAERFSIPIVVGGFEPLDILYAVALLLRQIIDRVHHVENAYPRAVDDAGNPAALRLLDEVFETTTGTWRGIGEIPESGYRFRPSFASLNARSRFSVPPIGDPHEIVECRCPEILTARAVPSDCTLFASRCTPISPVGPCMVGSEGACNIWFRFGGERDL